MEANETGVRNRILEAARGFLAEGYASDQITVRQIAKQASVGIGTISYYFDSKEKLLVEAAGGLLQDMAEELLRQEPAGPEQPVEKLRRFFAGACRLAVRHPKAFRIPIAYDLTQGDMSSAYYLLPLLKEICGSQKSELEIKLIALEMLSVLQAIFLKDRAFWKYTGIDIYNEKQLQEVIDRILNHAVGE